MSDTQNERAKLMGTGSIPKLFAQLALPAVVAQIINLLYNIVDRIYIGHIPEVGASALTGVGLFLPILMLINAFAMLAGSGGAPLAAIAMGQKDTDKAERKLFPWYLESVFPTLPSSGHCPWFSRDCLQVSLPVILP